MVKDCHCICKEKKEGPKEWKGLTKFRIAELDTLRGVPGYNVIESIIAKDTTEAIEKYYNNFPGSSNRILVYPEGCANIHSRSLSASPTLADRDSRKPKTTKPMYPSSEAADEALAH